VTAFASFFAVVALAAGGHGAPPSAVARALPAHYRLVLTETFEGDRIHVARYGRQESGDPGDAPLSIYSVRGRRRPPFEYSPEARQGDRATTVRGHPAVLRALDDQGGTFAHELIWRERADLVVAVEAVKPLGPKTLRRVAQHVRIVGRPAWARLYRQTSYRAQIGHVTRYMRHVRVARGTSDRHRWKLFALVPPHFPLSRDDLRVACYELRYRKRRTHGDGCGLVPSWRRLRGTVFTFGAVPGRVKHVRIRPDQGHAFDIRIPTVAIRRGPRVRYFATPLPERACAVVITPVRHPNAEGAIAAPISGRDQRRCARDSRP
jgi:hypothetical protein